MTSTEFDQIYLKTFNAQQIEAVHSVDGAVLLLAVPGSGKTTVLVTRLGYMIPLPRHSRPADPDHDLYRRRHRGDAPAICRSVRQRHR